MVIENKLFREKILELYERNTGLNLETCNENENTNLKNLKELIKIYNEEKIRLESEVENLSTGYYEKLSDTYFTCY
jgi:3-phenylpropionate/cinnamic acid dioxygenase small subunit